MTFFKTIPTIETWKVNLFFLALIILMFLILPLTLGDKATFIILDNLDGEFVYLHLLKVNGLLFGTSTTEEIEQVMGGLSRVNFHSEFKIIRLIFYIFPSFTAYIVNGTTVRMIGFLGMFLLARDYLTTERKFLSPYLGFLFAVIPLYTLFGITVSGLPLILWAFLNLRKGVKLFLSWSIIIVFPFYATFVLIAPFVLLFFFALGIYFIITKAGVQLGYWCAIVVLALLFVIGDVHLIGSFIFNKVQSHRSEWVGGANVPFSEMLWNFSRVFFKGHYHTTNFFVAPIYFLMLLSLYFGNTTEKTGPLIRWIFFAVFFIAAFFAIYPAIHSLIASTPLVAFQFHRFIFLVPLLLFIGFGIAIGNEKINTNIIAILMVIQLGLIIYSNNELKINLLKAVNVPTEKFYFHQPSFGDFFSKDSFSEIKAFIKKPPETYKVASVGIYPSISLYNGLYTVDGYHNHYPLSYKHEFRKIIEKELDKNVNMKTNFDQWGSRCYISSAELWVKEKLYFEKAHYSTPINNLDIDAQQLKKMGCEYILSVVPINNFKEIGLRYEKQFGTSQSLWTIYLYKLI